MTLFELKRQLSKVSNPVAIQLNPADVPSVSDPSLPPITTDPEIPRGVIVVEVLRNDG